MMGTPMCVQVALLYIVKVGVKGSGEGGAHHGGCIPSLHCNCDSLNEVMVRL